MFGYAYICECICAIEIIFCCKLRYLFCSHYSTLRPSRYFEIQCFTIGCTVRCISVEIEPVFGNVTASSAIRCIFQKVLERNNHALNSVFISVEPLSFAVHRAAFHYSREILIVLVRGRIDVVLYFVASILTHINFFYSFVDIKTPKYSR